MYILKCVCLNLCYSRRRLAVDSYPPSTEAACAALPFNHLSNAVANLCDALRRKHEAFLGRSVRLGRQAANLSQKAANLSQNHAGSWDEEEEAPSISKGFLYVHDAQVQKTKNIYVHDAQVCMALSRVCA